MRFPEIVSGMIERVCFYNKWSSFCLLVLFFWTLVSLTLVPICFTLIRLFRYCGILWILKSSLSVFLKTGPSLEGIDTHAASQKLDPPLFMYIHILHSPLLPFSSHVV